MITDERLDQLIELHQRDGDLHLACADYAGDHHDTAAALHELQQLREQSLILCGAIDKVGLGACVYWLVCPEEEPEIGHAVDVGEQAAAAIKAMLT